MKQKLRHSILNRLRHFAGRFNLTEFEAALIDQLLNSAQPSTRRIIRNQMCKFNRVRRVLHADDRIDHGSTTFYWHRFGRSRFSEFTDRLICEGGTEEMELGRCIAIDSDQRTIRVRFHALMGIFTQITFRSDDRIWYPIGEFEIRELVLNGI